MGSSDQRDQVSTFETETGILLFSLVQVENRSFGPKQNTKFTVNHHPPTENFSQGSRHSKRLKLNT